MSVALHSLRNDSDFDAIRQAVSTMLNDQWPRSELQRLKSIDEVSGALCAAFVVLAASVSRAPLQSSDAFPMSVVLLVDDDDSSNSKNDTASDNTTNDNSNTSDAAPRRRRRVVAYCKLSVVLSTPRLRQHYAQPMLIVENGASRRQRFDDVVRLTWRVDVKSSFSAASEAKGSASA